MCSAQLSIASTAAASFVTVAGLLGTLYYLLDIPGSSQKGIKSTKVRRCYEPTELSIADFKALTSQVTSKRIFPLAVDVQKNIPIYDAKGFSLEDECFVSELQDELYHILLHGPGVFVIQNFFQEHAVLDIANNVFESIILHERTNNSNAGDHFAPASANSRIWNSFSKHALTSPENFLEYYSNPLFPLVCGAYLGPAYKITTQLNVVRPGGRPQVSHRDYHLGFQTAAATTRWPKAAQIASALLTLQGAVAHTDMPLESGPTRFLPFSQKYEQGYVAYRREDFNAYFLENWVSLPLCKGDAVFFSPAIFHAAGENRTKDLDRSANLVQVSSAFGKTMESVDSLPIIKTTYKTLSEKFGKEGMSRDVEAFVEAVAEGYPFPTNLDQRPPAPGGMAPESEQDILKKALNEGWETDRVMGELTRMRQDSKA